jgi:dihydroorotate dehydrogenase (NAD+) catalytic subunit
MIKQVQLYDDQLDFGENKLRGPFGDYAQLGKPYHNQGEPQYDFFGTPVYSPFGIGAGPLPTPKFIQATLDKGFDIVTLKNVRTAVFPLNPYPHVRPVKIDGDVNPSLSETVEVANEYSSKLAVANSFGIPSVAPAEWQAHFRQADKLPQKGQVLLAAFQGIARGKGRDDFVQDHVHGVELIRQTGDHIIEINLACPNEGEAVLACFDNEISTHIVQAVRAANPDLKFLIKLAYFANKNELKKLIKNVGDLVDGITAINTIPKHVVDPNGTDTFPDRLGGLAGISGAPVKWAGLEMTQALQQFRAEFGYDYKIVGMGGVLSAADFHEYRDAGADIVMSVTGAMWNPNLAAEIKASLKP